METTQKANSFKKKDKSYYLNSDKFVRDLVHGYVYLTKFDMELISTVQFQRLKDIRQLTCQSVYPAARHTRFEHSLGVMELTRKAIQNLNENGYLAKKSEKREPLIDEQLQFNAALAALLHDVGHCPFSHMGEVEFDEDEVWERLYGNVTTHEELQNTDLVKIFEDMKNGIKKKKGAIHEQLSCIAILEKFNQYLSKVREEKISIEQGVLYVDYELLIRCILGIEYDTTVENQYEKTLGKNVIVNLINSKILDMDKLDYVMRDSFYTGIGAPSIDTDRLFRNMHLDSENECKLVFKNRAVPVLQNFIESRDSLYMYVYNHHTAVFSDFMNSYIFRRLAHNQRDLLIIAENIIEEFFQKHSDEIAITIPLDEIKKEIQLNNYALSNIGMVPKDYLFSSEAVVDQNRSDSDLISLLNILHYSLGENCRQKNNLSSYIDGELIDVLSYVGFDNAFIKFKSELQLKEKYKKIKRNCVHIHQLINDYQSHKYLKPWWKTHSEFENFLDANFIKDERIRAKLCAWISQDKNNIVDGQEFRSQLAKNVINITQCLYKKNKNISRLLCPLETGDFFVIQRSARFFDPETISGLDIALKCNEVLGTPEEVNYRSGEFYIKTLDKVIPQRDYYSMYAEKSFYIFSKRLPEDRYDLRKRTAHYRQIEQIFVFVAETLIRDGARKFQQNYSNAENELSAHKEMYERYKNDVVSER